MLDNMHDLFFISWISETEKERGIQHQQQQLPQQAERRTTL